MTEEEIEELITGAINKEHMMNLGVIKSEDTTKGNKNPAENMKMVSMKQFKDILYSDVKESKSSKVKGNRVAKS